MFDVPIDAWFAWLGVAAVSGTVLAVAAGLPAAPPPDAGGAASTVDRVAAGQHAAAVEHAIEPADAVRIGTDSLSVRGGGGHAHAALRYGPVTPVVDDGRLRRVLEGAPVDEVFDSPSSFGRTAAASRRADPTWQRTDRIVVRRVTWEAVDVVLVG